MSIFNKLFAAFMAVMTSLSSFAASLGIFTPGDNPVVEVVPEKTITIIENGASPYVIVCGKAAGDPEYTAALKLQHYLKSATGVELPIVSDSAEPSEYEIIVGKTNREDNGCAIDRTAFGDETVYAETRGNTVIIAGGEKRGTLYAVYEVLSSYLDFHWYTSTVISIPEADSIKLPADKVLLDYTPVFEYRETDWISPKDKEYSLANHLNSGIYRQLTEEEGGTVRYAGLFGHSLTTQFVNADIYFESHPEYFALRDGVRIPNQLCLTNSEVRNLVVEQVRATLIADPGAKIVSLTQNDNLYYCTCESCAALDEKEGSQSGTMIDFVNYVANALGEEFPEVEFDTFAYQYTRKPPKNIKPASNVLVRLCSIECCFSHPLNDKDCSQNADFCTDLEGWAEICNKLYVWDYTTNYHNYCAPFPNFGVMQANMQFFAESNVVGVYEEGNYTAEECDAEFAELRAYLLSRLLFDPYCDYDAEMNSFLEAYYGPGWQYIRKYIDMTTSNTGVTKLFTRYHMGIYTIPMDTGVLDLSPCEILYMNWLWDQALALAENDEQILKITKSQLSWRYWKACKQVDEFLLSVTREERYREFYEDLKKYGITRISEGPDGSLSSNPDFGLTPRNWKESR